MKREHVNRLRALRRRSTCVEKQLWNALRNRKISGCKFRRQYVVERYVLDFYCPERHLAVEVDGGGHARGDRSDSDLERGRFLADRGIRVLRFWNHQVRDHLEDVLVSVATSLQEDVMRDDTSPSPRSSPRRGEEAEHRSSL